MSWLDLQTQNLICSLKTHNPEKRKSFLLSPWKWIHRSCEVSPCARSRWIGAERMQALWSAASFASFQGMRLIPKAPQVRVPRALTSFPSLFSGRAGDPRGVPAGRSPAREARAAHTHPKSPGPQARGAPAAVAPGTTCRPRGVAGLLSFLGGTSLLGPARAGIPDSQGLTPALCAPWLLRPLQRVKTRLPPLPWRLQVPRPRLSLLIGWAPVSSKEYQIANLGPS